MRTGRVWILTLIMMLCAVLTMSGCTTYDNFRSTFIEDSPEMSMPVITIGVLEPQSGTNASRGRDEIKGIELAHSIYSNVDGYRISLAKVDTQSRVSTARTAIQGLIGMEPVAVIGCAGEASSLAVSEFMEDAGIPAITPSATNPLITQTNNYYFRACITENQMGEGLAEYAYRELNSRRIGMISLKNDSSTAAVIDGFGSKIKKLAGKKSRAIACVSELTQITDELPAALDDIESRECDVCFVSLGVQAMDDFFTQVENRKLTGITFLGTRSWGSPEFAQVIEKHPGIKAVFPYFSVISGTDQAMESETEEAERFRIEYAGRYGVDDIPSENAALGYDSYLLIINAIHNSLSLKGSDVRDALLGLKNLKGATGVFTFDSNGNVVRTINLCVYKDGQIVTEYVTRSEAEAGELNELKSQDVED